MLGVGGGGTGIVQAQKIESAVTKSYFGPPVARLRCQSSVGGILDGNSPLGECTDPDSDSAGFKFLSCSSPVFKG